MVTVMINGAEVELATTLRVAYMVQGQHNHMAYTKVFSDIGNMTIEDQIGILFCAYQVANKNGCFNRQAFQDYYLDNFDLSEVLDQLTSVIEGITGEKLQHNDAAQVAHDAQLVGHKIEVVEQGN